ncbi:MAG: hypothetical protein R3316_03035 [Rhodovibrionaceae bacterium]|nr:hypothetical protein [Rhodovibrionaceae bacterium]
MSNGIFDHAVRGFLWALGWAVRLAPGLALLSLTVTAEGLLAWSGLLGLVPLALAFTRLPGCACGRAGGSETGFRSWPSY